MKKLTSREGELNGGPRFTGSPKVKSAFATLLTKHNTKTNTSEIVFFILIPFQYFSLFQQGAF
jgi:hypothetical protein